MPWISWPAEKKPVSFLEQLKTRVNELPPGLFALSAAAAGSTATLGSYGLYRRFFRRIQNSDWILPQHLNAKRWLKGQVTSVGDSDNFRFYHQPGFGWNFPIKFRSVPSNAKDLKGQTLHVRIAGVDAPEAAHFGRPAQPYSAEALRWLQSTIHGRRVWVQPVSRDQYGRIVSIVKVPSRFVPSFISKGKNLSIEMLRVGWVTTYEQAGASYGTEGKDEFLRVEAEAKAARRGQWASGLTSETPAEYKRRHAELEAVAKKDTQTQSPSSANEVVSPRRGWFSWFKR
ncbi:hypothetical protein DL96DRAFT_312732 [Flagelloscypha sp. PMI_526]|nr:hypothetical protein DL96DRAFT_312732 [Flagelloscypha sp. PMI_526]